MGSIPHNTVIHNFFTRVRIFKKIACSSVAVLKLINKHRSRKKQEPKNEKITANSFNAMDVVHFFSPPACLRS